MSNQNSPESAELVRLRDENVRLRRENQELREEIANLKIRLAEQDIELTNLTTRAIGTVRAARV